MGPGGYLTYQILAPRSTHWRPATCEEIRCPYYLLGWTSRILESDPDQAGIAAYIRGGAGRQFTEARTSDGLTEFRFPAGQKCFDAHLHRMRLDADEIFVRRDGDRRGNPSGRAPVILGPQSWVDDFGEHQEQLNDLIRRG